MKFPAIKTQKLTAMKKICSGVRVVDYWAWAHSDLVDNIERGIFAEFLVHTAMNEADTVRSNWKSCYVISPEGISIEVKSSGYIQSWGHEELSTISFSIKPSYVWNPETDSFTDKCTRHSDVYVFCLHKHTEQESLNILDLEQWTFFVLPTAVLDAEASTQKTITLNRLKSLGAVETDYYGLRETAIQAAKHDEE